MKVTVIDQENCSNMVLVLRWGQKSLSFSGSLIAVCKGSLIFEPFQVMGAKWKDSKKKGLLARHISVPAKLSALHLSSNATYVEKYLIDKVVQDKNE